MDYRNLGRTGVKVSPLCLGCMNFGWKTEEKESIDIINAALDAGINFLDTANIYAHGKSETIVGKAFQENGRRDRIILATKVHNSMDDNDPNAQGNSRRHIIQQCEASLQRLQTEYIDLYQMHRPQPATAIDETLRALDDLVRSGKVRYIGASTFGAWQIVESLWASKELGLNRFVCEQPPYHILDRRIERELVPVAQTYGLALIPWSPLAGGFLTGKYQRHQQRPPQSRFGEEQGTDWAERAFNDKTFDVIEALTRYVPSKACTLSQFALAWCAAQPAMTSPIIGPRSLEQLRDNLKALDVTITDEDCQLVDKLAPPGRATIDYYQADFGQSPHRF